MTIEHTIPLEQICFLAEGLIGPEGPSALPDGSIAFVTQGTRAALLGEVRLVRPDGQIVTLLSSALGVHGTAFDRAHNSLYLAKFDVDRSPIKPWAGRGADRLGAGVFRIDLADPHAVTPLYAGLDGNPLAGPLALVADEWGDLWITDGFHSDGSLLWGAANGSMLCRVVPSLPGANSIAMGPDRRTLYLASEGKLVAFEIAGRGELVSQNGTPIMRVIANFAPNTRPDGICIEACGNIVVGCWDEGLITFSPTGEVVAHTRLEGHGVVNLALGGKDRMTLHMAVNESGKKPDDAPGKIAAIRWPRPGLELC